MNLLNQSELAQAVRTLRALPSKDAMATLDAGTFRSMGCSRPWRARKRSSRVNAMQTCRLSPTMNGCGGARVRTPKEPFHDER